MIHSRLSSKEVLKRNRRWTLLILFPTLAILIWILFQDFNSTRNKPSCKQQQLYETLLTINDDGIITNKKDGAKWFKCNAGQTPGAKGCTGVPIEVNYEEALKYVEDFSLSSGMKWRLPTNKEFKFITESTCINPSVNLNYFKNILISNYWTSTVSRRGKLFGCAYYALNGRISCLIRKKQKLPIMLIQD